MNKQLLVGIALSSLSFAVFAKGIPVTTSFTILQDVTQQIGKDRVDVTTIIGPNEDAHVYQLKPSDVKKIKASKALLINGIDFESHDFTKLAEQNKVPLFVATKDIKPMKGEDHDHADKHDHDHEHGEAHHHHHEYDPHIWNDPVLMLTYAKNVKDALVKIDPKGKKEYEKSYEEYVAKLKDLNKWVEGKFAPIAVDKRKVLTAHDAFNYFGKRYNVKFIAPEGVSEDSEASAKQVANIAKQIKKEHFKAVFIENIKDPKLIQQLSKETGIKVDGELYSDALSKKDGPAPTYIDLVKYNVEQITKALQK